MKYLCLLCLIINMYIPSQAQHNIEFKIQKLSEFNSSFPVIQNGSTVLLDRHFVLIEFSFHTNTPTQVLLFDKYALCMSCPQNTVLLKKPYPLPPYQNLLVLKDSLSKSEVIIENKKGKYKIFNIPHNYKELLVSHKTRLYGCGWTLPDEPCEKIYELTGDKPVKFKIDILVNDLKIQDTDEEIRLHYVFKPTERQKKLGFTQSFILTSNWIKLTE